MYEKKNKLSQPAILIEISLTQSIVIIFMKNRHFSLKHSLLMGASQNIDFICPFEIISDAVFTF